jgi:hypothetical protein
MNWNEIFRYEDGFLYWKEAGSGRDLSKPAGTLESDGYVKIVINGKRHRAHRIIWQMFNGSIPDEIKIDHRDLDRANNDILNLRLGSNQENARNTGKQSNNTSGYKGVSYNASCKKKWVANAKVNGKTKYIGCFDTPELAYEAYCEYVKPIHGEFFHP